MSKDLDRLKEEVKEGGLYFQRTKLYEIEVKHAQEKVELSRKIDDLISELKKADKRIKELTDDTCSGCSSSEPEFYFCAECYAQEEGALRDKIKALELVFEAVGWPCATCDTEPRVAALSKTVYCATPCEGERAYAPKDWIAKQKAAEQQQR